MAVYDFMKKWKSIDLGQVFTPLHLARFAAKIIDINENDVVLDSSAGSGALLLAALERGAKEAYGIEYDGQVYNLLQNNLSQTDVKYEVINEDASSETAADFIRSHGITKAILNPPYEKKFKTYEILMNTLDNLPAGTKVALFYPQSHLDKPGKKWADDFKSKHTLEKVINLPSNCFQPFASTSCALYIITANEPQGDKKIWGCEIKEDGLQRKKNKYREDTNGKWGNELEPYWSSVILEGVEDETVTEWSPDEGFAIHRKIDLTPTHEDFRTTIEDYMSWKISQLFMPTLSECQIKLAALCYFVGPRNVLDFLDNSNKEQDSKTDDLDSNSCFTYDEFIQTFSQEEILQYSDEMVQMVLQTSPKVAMEWMKTGIINNGILDFKKLSEYTGGIVPVKKEVQPDWEYMNRYVTAIEKEILVEVVKYKKQLLEQLEMNRKEHTCTKK